MPRPRPPHLHREVTRHGKPCGTSASVAASAFRIKAEFGTPDFDAEYQAGHQRAATSAKGDRVGHPCVAPRALPRNARLARSVIGNAQAARGDHSPRSSRRRALSLLQGSPAQTIVAGRDRRASTPAQARHFLETMRGTVSGGPPRRHWSKKTRPSASKIRRAPRAADSRFGPRNRLRHMSAAGR